MANAGKPIIYRTSAGFWHLGRESKSGVQLDIENFISLKDAVLWARSSQPNATFVVGDVRLTQEGAWNLWSLLNGWWIANHRGLKRAANAGLCHLPKGELSVAAITQAGIALFAPAGQHEETSA